MTKRRIVLMLFLCCLTALLTVQALSQTRSSNRSAKSSDTTRSREMTDAERRKKAAERQKQRELREKKLAKEGRGPLIDRKQRDQENRKRAAEMRGDFLLQKAALGASEEQWKLIKEKLEKVRLLRGQANSMVGVLLAGGSNDNETNLRARARTKVPVWQWKRPWKDKALSELTDSQKLAKRLIALVETKSTTSEQFKRTMDALRKARREEAEIEKQLSEVHQELREILTPRHEAALVLMKWL